MRTHRYVFTLPALLAAASVLLPAAPALAWSVEDALNSALGGVLSLTAFLITWTLRDILHLKDPVQLVFGTARPAADSPFHTVEGGSYQATLQVMQDFSAGMQDLALRLLALAVVLLAVRLMFGSLSPQRRHGLLDSFWGVALFVILLLAGQPLLGVVREIFYALLGLIQELGAVNADILTAGNIAWLGETAGGGLIALALVGLQIWLNIIYILRDVFLALIQGLWPLFCFFVVFPGTRHVWENAVREWLANLTTPLFHAILLALCFRFLGFEAQPVGASAAPGQAPPGPVAQLSPEELAARRAVQGFNPSEFEHQIGMPLSDAFQAPGERAPRPEPPKNVLGALAVMLAFIPASQLPRALFGVGGGTTQLALGLAGMGGLAGLAAIAGRIGQVVRLGAGVAAGPAGLAGAAAAGSLAGGAAAAGGTASPFQRALENLRAAGEAAPQWPGRLASAAGAVAGAGMGFAFGPAGIYAGLRAGSALGGLAGRAAAAGGALATGAAGRIVRADRQAAAAGMDFDRARAAVSLHQSGMQLAEAEAGRAADREAAAEAAWTGARTELRAAGAGYRQRWDGMSHEERARAVEDLRQRSARVRALKAEYAEARGERAAAERRAQDAAWVFQRARADYHRHQAALQTARLEQMAARGRNGTGRGFDSPYANL